MLKLNDSRLGVRNNERGVVTAVDLGQHRLSLDLSDRTVWLPRDYLQSATQRGEPTLRHGYAITAYVAQGLTCERAYVLARDDAYREWAYTTMTRARARSHLYVVAVRSTARDEFAPAAPERDPRGLLVAALSRSEDRGLAAELERSREDLERER